MLDKKYLLPEDAIRIILEQISFRCLPSETMPIEEAYDRVTAEDVLSQEDLPGFERSTVDGFAVRSSDTFGARESSPAYLTIKGDIPMGAIPDFSLSNGEAASIATGGMLPAGADAVVMIEHVNIVSENMIEILRAVSPGENVIFRDEDTKTGEVVIKAGHKLKPQDIGALAGLGITELQVIKKPVVSIILTGDEIIPHTEKNTPGKVRDVNSFTLAGLTMQCGGIPLKMGIVRDEYTAIKEITKKAHEISDIVLITGGTSAGIKDLTAKIIDELGLPGVLFHGASIKPGKPVIGGVCNSRPVFGLPGHPVAVYICFELFVKPVLNQMLGLKDKIFKNIIKARIARSIHSQAGREDFIRVHLEEKNGEIWAYPLLSKSGLIMSLVKADGVLCIPSDLLGVEEGEEVSVIIID
ncbi:gephyrin-like molybdotransferase Glp [Thermodesulfovibrio thiophilus]|uniref:molybdopterin molybdotransferase MoeA n=1 Tax=Thermodesulfovibrio thiophilus TaxID=340095 RepID=UPI0018023424|nr:gephyrin-like molybdotransferase Glp [Thermodesulfovibrio thiophilus]HHW20494.1 molybdopterin molybdotransferase MoeA [Thermodesulfovibrio thiophilus]